MDRRSEQPEIMVRCGDGVYRGRLRSIRSEWETERGVLVSFVVAVESCDGPRWGSHLIRFYRLADAVAWTYLSRLGSLPLELTAEAMKVEEEVECPIP